MTNLLIRNLTLSTTNPVQGGPVTVSFDLVNNGSATSTAFFTDLYASVDPYYNVNEGQVINWTWAYGIAANSSEHFSHTLHLSNSLLPGRTYYIGAMADTTFAVTETSKTDNSSAIAITIASPVPQPNHVDPTVSIHDISTPVGTAVSISSLNISINNPSGDLITQYVFFDAGSGGGYIAVNGVAQPYNQNIYVNIADLSTVKYVGGAVAGSETLAVSVYDYTTNSYSIPGTAVATTTATTPTPNPIPTPNPNAAKPDLFVVGDRIELSSGPVWEPTLNPGDLFSFLFWIDNLGLAPATDFNTGVYLSTDFRITSADRLLFSFNSSGLSASSSNYTGGDFGLPNDLLPGIYYIGALADFDSRISETDETNNGSVGLKLIVEPLRSSNLTGTSGRDVFFSSSAVEIIDGGAGLDTVVYGTIIEGLTVSPQGNQLSVRGDTLLNIERVQGSDGVIAFDIQGNAGDAYRLYQAAFNRIPDKDGLSFWTHQLDLGLNAQVVAQGFVNSSEFRSVYGTNPTNVHIVDLMYQNVLGRAGEPAGINFWVGQLDRGLAVGALLQGFAISSENHGIVDPTLTMGILLNSNAFLV